MKKILIVAVAALALAACAPKQEKEARVMARFVPERMDDFVWENNLVAGRAYGEALEGNPTSPGFDVWVKLPGKLVANEWYEGAQQDPNFYHHNHGGKDCYKVAVSLGGGASAPLVGGELCYPATNFRSHEILEQSAEKVVFVLNYPEWDAKGVKVSLAKKITVTPDTYYLRVDDIYSFDAESLEIAAGVNRHAKLETLESEVLGEDYYALWEHASDQSVEPEEGMLGVGVYMPYAERVCYSEDMVHGMCVKTVHSCDTLTYYFGSCWSAGDVKTSEDWFNIVNSLKNE